LKIFVSGSCGYQGSLLVPKLLNLGHKVIALDTQWFGKNLLKNKNLKIIKKNILNMDYKDLHGASHIIHLSAIANDPMGDIDKNITWEVSCSGTMRLSEIAKKNKIQKLIYASSASVYGVKKEKKVHENLSLEPISTYNKAKMITERVLLSYNKDFNVVIIRPATVCGFSPRMRFDLSVNMLTYQGLLNNLITVHGGSQVRPNIHIQDLLKCYIFFLNKKVTSGEIFNAGFENLSILQIANLIKEKLNCKIKVFKNINDIRSYRVDSSKLQKLGFKPEKKVADAVDEIVHKIRKENYKVHQNSFSLDWLKNNKNFIKLI